MGNLRQSILFLILFCWLVCGCSELHPTGPAVKQSGPPTVEIPVAVAEISSTPEAVTEQIIAENRPERLKVVVKPPPIRKPPKAKPTPKSKPQKRPNPKVSLNSAYPKAQTSDAVIKKAERASLTLDKHIQSGRLVAGFWGTGDLQDMVQMRIHNSSGREIRVRLEPGMILKPEDYQQVQPLLVTEKAEFVLQPGESYSTDLQSYCMDSRVPAPLAGEAVNYQFSRRTKDGGPRAVLAQQAAEKLAKSSPYRHAIVQVSIWKSLNQPVEERHLYSVLGRDAANPEVRQEVFRQVDLVLRHL